jgi:hypothetical protein
MALVPPSPSMNAMVDTITNAVETMFTDCHVVGPPRYVIQSTVRRALRDIDAGRAPLRRFNGVRTVAGTRRSTPRLVYYAPSVCPRHCSATTFTRRLDGASSTPMPQPQMSSPNAFMLPKPCCVADVVFNRSTGSHCPLAWQRRRSKRLATRLRLRP